MKLFADAGYMDDYTIEKKGRKVIACCVTEDVTCFHTEAVTLREGITPVDYALNKKAVDKLHRRMMAHVDRTHRPNRFTPRTATVEKRPLPKDPPF